MNRRRPDMKPLVTVAGTAIPDPSEYNATTSTVVDSARNVKGYMVGAVIRDGICKIECRWKYLDADTWAEILCLFEESKSGHFINDVTFLNQTTNQWETHEMYCSDRTAGMFLRKDDGSVIGYKECRISLIEV